MGGVRRKKTRKNTTIKILRGARKKRKPIKLGDKVMEKHWDHSKTLQQNMCALGLAYDPNTTKKKKKLSTDGDGDEMEIEKQPSVKTAVVTEFEKQAANGKKFERHISPDEAKFLMKLMKTHKTNYDSMCKDKRNTYQHTANQLRRKCEGLLNSSLLSKYQEMFPDLCLEDMET